jgi:hypothetical protein
MELWIRSQDKESLIKVSNVVLREQISPYMDRTKIYYLEVCYDNLQTLGKYKTKERALEVLDEIQRLMIASLVDKNLDGYGVVIYEMPKE